MVQLPTTINLDVSDPQSVHSAITAIAHHVSALHDEIQTFALVLGAAISAADMAGARAMMLSEIMLATIEASKKNGASGEALHFLEVGLKAASSTPPDGGTRLKIVQVSKKAA